MPSKAVATLEHETLWTDLFRPTGQQTAQRLKSLDKRNTNPRFLNAPSFRFTFTHLFV
jgi:hypothetical protein